MGSVIDFHTHILPKLDDGSSSVEMSVAMLREELKQGINKVLLTPHFYANYDSPERFLERREKSLEMLKAAVNGMEDVSEFSVGAEVRYFDGISDCDYLEKFTIEGTKCVLVEIPSRGWNERMLLELGAIYPKRRLMPIVAHADRCVTPFRSPSVFDCLASLPVKIQVNAEYFLRMGSRREALRMLSEGKIHFLGSDCHNLTDRKPNLGSAIDYIERRLGASALAEINNNEHNFNL